MTISQVHHRFVELLKFNEALTNPQEFLGPNTDQLLDFWLRLDGLSFNQWEIIAGRYRNFCDKQYSEWRKAVDEAHDASNQAIGEEFAYEAAEAAWNIYSWSVASYANYYTTREIIGGIENPVFLKMFDNL